MTTGAKEAPRMVRGAHAPDSIPANQEMRR
jgi:hypothetical protein